MIPRGLTMSIPFKLVFHFNVNMESLKRWRKKEMLMQSTAEYQTSSSPPTQQYRQKRGRAVILPSL